jgi:hypothetical protein
MKRGYQQKLKKHALGGPKKAGVFSFISVILSSLIEEVDYVSQRNG